MRLYRNIFKVTEDNIRFLLYLYEHPQFTTEDICQKFSLKYSTLFNHLKSWIRQGYIIEEKQPPGLGEFKYKYSLSEKALKKLNLLKKKMNNFSR